MRDLYEVENRWVAVAKRPLTVQRAVRLEVQVMHTRKLLLCVEHFFTPSAPEIHLSQI